MSEFEYSVPVIVAGGGACGAVAAIAAHDAGAEVIVIERDPHPMGTSAMSQGVFCAAGTRFQKEAGIEDSADIFFNDIMEKTKGKTDPVIARLIADESAPTLEWLCESHNFPWELNSQFRAAYGNTRDRIHGWSGHAGEEMMQWFHRRLSDLEIDVLCDTKLLDVFTSDLGNVTGVKLQGGDGEVTSIGCQALVMACGGFGANRKMTDRYMPETKGFRYNGHEGSEGDAIRIGAEHGASLGDMGSFQGYAMLAEPGGISVPPNVLIEGGFIVNSKGKRFTDESKDIAGMVLPLSKQAEGLGWVIFDQTIYDMAAHIPELQDLEKLGVVKQAATVAELSDLTGLPEENLQSALEDISDTKSAHKADKFGRNWNESRVLDGEYRYIKVTGALYHTQGGLQIDDHARVTRVDGSVFANMFAGGGSARSVSGPSSWGYLPAMGLTTAIVLGQVAGREAGKFVSA